MKKVFYFLTMALCLCAFSSCSQNDENVVDVKNVPQVKSYEYQNLMCSIDSLNAAYLSNVPSSSTRGLLGYIFQGGVEKVADNAGRVVGSYIGRNVGCAIGFLGSPVACVAGYLIGRTVGGVAGSVLASYGASCLFSNTRAYAVSDSCKFDYYLPVDAATTMDSIGYYHNLAMTELSKNRAKYYDENGELDYELIYDDCVKILKENGFDDNGAYQDADLRKEVISYAKEAVAVSADCKNGKISADEYNTILADGMRKKGVPEEEVVVFSDFAVKVVNTTNYLPLEIRKQYADDVNSMIATSSLESSMKEEMRSTTNMIVNSSICCDNLR